MKNRNRLNLSVLLEVRMVITLGEVVTGQGHKGTSRVLDMFYFLVWIQVTQKNSVHESPPGCTLSICSASIKSLKKGGHNSLFN